MPSSVTAALQRALEARPEAIALVDRRRRLTYRELATEVDGAAAALNRRDVVAGTRVAASLPNGVDIVVAFLATLRLGAVWVGIHRAYTAAERQALLDDAEPTVYLTEPLAAAPVPGPLPPSTVAPTAPAAIAYTSGTTGAPKGAVHSQHNLVVAAAMTDQGGGGDRIGVCLPLTTLNLMILGAIQALVRGGTCVCMDRTDAVGVAEWVAEERIDRMSVPPTIAYDLLTSQDVAPSQLQTLVQLGVGAAHCPEGLDALYLERFGHPLRVGYGLTEAPSVVARQAPGTAGATGSDGSPVSAGIALPHLAVTIRDDEGACLSAGQRGEICVGAAPAGRWADLYTTMLGYWRKPDESREALRGGVLHTGDVGWLDGDANLFVMGRRAEVIVRGGVTIHPAEIERVVGDDPQVAECAVVGRTHPRLGEEVVVFVRPLPGEAFDAGEARARCAERLARHKVPAEFIIVDRLPRNAMGKVVRSDLHPSTGSATYGQR